MQDKQCIAIDIGTIDSKIYVFNKEINRPEPKFSVDSEFIPTLISYENENGSQKVIFGSETTKNTICDITRLVGVPLNSQFLQKLIPFLKDEGINIKKLDGSYPNDDLYVKFNVCTNIDEQKWETPEKILGDYIKWLVEEIAGIEIIPRLKLVLTVPSIFSRNKRKAFIDASIIAGFKETNVFLLNSPSAVAISYLQQECNKNKNFRKLMIADFGGGNFDLSLFSVSNNDFQVITVEGDLYLGGKDIDQIIYQWVKQKCQEQFDINPSDFSLNDNKKLMHECKKAKEQLTFEDTSSISVECKNTFHSIILTRDEFNLLCSPLMSRIESLIMKMLRDVYIDPAEIDGIILVGGSSKIPIFKNKICEMFNENIILEFDKYRESVGLGGCYFAAMKQGLYYNQNQKMNYNQKLAHSFGIGTRTLQMKDDEKDLFSKVLKKNDTIPRKSIEYFTKLHATSCQKYKIYEGDDEHVVEDGFIDSLINDKLPFKPAGEHKTEMTMEIDENGILEVKGLVIGVCGVFNRYDMAIKKKVLGDFCENSVINQSFPKEYQKKEEDCGKLMDVINFAQSVHLI